MVMKPKRVIGTSNESMVDVVMNAMNRGEARELPPIKMFSP
jgi:flavin-binding protein dodecin